MKENAEIKPHAGICKIRRRMNKNLLFLTILLAATVAATIGQALV